MLFQRIVFYAFLVGLLSGAVLTVTQLWHVVPIIQSAEQYESAAVQAPVSHHENTGHAGHSQHGEHSDHAGHSGHAHDADAWEPAPGIERTGYTFLSNVLTAVGFALLVLVAMVAIPKAQTASRLNWQYGLLWGAAGYIVFYLAPSLGMPPEIPGASVGSLESRQIWWLLTVVCTAAGLAGLAFGKSPWRWIAPLLLVVPYLVARPHAPESMFPGRSPTVTAELEQLAQQFFGATAISNAALWLILGLASIWAVRRIILSNEME